MTIKKCPGCQEVWSAKLADLVAAGWGRRKEDGAWKWICPSCRRSGQRLPLNALWRTEELFTAYGAAMAASALGVSRNTVYERLRALKELRS